MSYVDMFPQLSGRDHLLCMSWKITQSAWTEKPEPENCGQKIAPSDFFSGTVAVKINPKSGKLTQVFIENLGGVT
jgi:hypothetical protein